MKLVIIESPYSGDVASNLAYARRCVIDSLRRNEAPIASHLLYTQPGILNDDIEAERSLGIRAGLAWARVADIQAFYTDQGWSAGMRAAFLHARRRAGPDGIEIEFRALDGRAQEPPGEN